MKISITKNTTCYIHKNLKTFDIILSIYNYDDK